MSICICDSNSNSSSCCSFDETLSHCTPQLLHSTQVYCSLSHCRCECPFGYTGPACEVEVFPACKMAPNASEMHCGDRMPRSCECLRQCWRHFCSSSSNSTCETPRDPLFVRCFERLQPRGILRSTAAAAAVDAAQPGNEVSSRSSDKGQISIKAGAGVVGGKTAAVSFVREGVHSDIPDEVEEQQGLVRWYRGIKVESRRDVITRQQATFVRALAPGGANMTALPLSQCPGRCLNRGQCIKTYTVGPHCLCWQGYTGRQCEQVGVKLDWLCSCTMLHVPEMGTSASSKGFGCPTAHHHSRGI
jgi:hypothetical protein